MKKVFRLFISSTFEDFRVERAVLQRFVFPKIKEVAHKKGISFLPIDLRWGIPQEAQEDHKTIQICLNEINRSAEEIHPDFLIMIGNRYGWIPLPEKIEKNEYNEIIRYTKNKSLFNKWYKLDENEIPGSYILQPVYETLANISRNKRFSIWYEEMNIMINDIHSIIDKTNLKSKKDKYFLSATHQEYLFYKKISKLKNIDINDTLIAYLREINHINFYKNSKFFEKLEGYKLKNYMALKKEIFSFQYTYKQVIASENILNRILEEDIKTIQFENLPDYLKNFAIFVTDSILNNIEKETNRKKSFNFHNSYKNNILQDALVNQKLIGREDDIENIKNLLVNHNKIIISSKSGIGKSTIIAKLIEELKKNNHIIFRFCGVENIKDAKSLMIDILLNEFKDKLDESFIKLIKKDTLTISDKERKLETELIKNKFLELTQNKLLILDAIDQLENKEEDFFDWFPNNFIISVLNDNFYKSDSIYYKILRTIPSIKEYKLKPLKNQKDIKELILYKLKKVNRTLTSNQLNYVLNKKDINKPLYIILAIEKLKHWKDDKNNPSYNPYKDKSKAKIASYQKTIVKEFIKDLYKIHKHDELLVKKSFGYMYASQNHLDEELLIDVLSQDENVMKNINKKWHINITNRLPDAVWARLRADIINLLTEDKQGNFKFFHREFNNAIKEIYNKEVGKQLLSILETFPIQNKVLIAHAYTIKNVGKIYNYDWFVEIYDKIYEYLKYINLNKKELEIILNKLLKLEKIKNVEKYILNIIVLNLKILPFKQNKTILNSSKEAYELVEKLIKKYKIKNSYILKLHELQYYGINFEAIQKKREIYWKAFDFVKELIDFVFENIEFFKELGFGINLIINNYLKPLSLQVSGSSMIWGEKEYSFIPRIILLEKQLQQISNIDANIIKDIEVVLAFKKFSDRPLYYRFSIFYKLFLYYLNLENYEKIINYYETVEREANLCMKQLISFILEYKLGDNSIEKILNKLDEIIKRNSCLDDLKELYCFLIDIELFDLAEYILDKLKDDLLKEEKIVYYTCRLFLYYKDFDELNKLLSKDNLNKSFKLQKLYRFINYDKDKMLLTNTILKKVLKEIDLNKSEQQIITNIIVKNYNEFLYSAEEQFVIFFKILKQIESLYMQNPNKKILNLHIRYYYFLFKKYNYTYTTFFENLKEDDCIWYITYIREKNYVLFIELIYIFLKKGYSINKIKTLYIFKDEIEDEELLKKQKFILKCLFESEPNKWIVPYLYINNKLFDSEEIMNIICKNYGKMKKQISYIKEQYPEILEEIKRLISIILDSFIKDIQSGKIEKKDIKIIFQELKWDMELYKIVMKQIQKKIKND